jgi:hypothetical protein
MHKRVLVREQPTVRESTGKHCTCGGKKARKAGNMAYGAIRRRRSCGPYKRYGKLNYNNRITENEERDQAQDRSSPGHEESWQGGAEKTASRLWRLKIVKIGLIPVFALHTYLHQLPQMSQHL